MDQAFCDCDVCHREVNWLLEYMHEFDDQLCCQQCWDAICEDGEIRFGEQ
jgi:hypothetical protein